MIWYKKLGTEKSLECILELELIREHFKKINNERDNDLTIANLINTIEGMLMEDIGSLKDDMFDEVGQEMTLTEMVYNDKTVIEYFISNVHKLGKAREL